MRPQASLLILWMLPAMACGGNGSLSVDSGGIGGTGALSHGPVTAIGSRVVNGTRWDLDDATISSDGVSGFSESDLPLGRVVTIQGTRSADGLTGVASSARFDPRLRGPVEAGSIVALGDRQVGLRILGVAVIVDTTTFLDPPELVLSDGQLLEVDGLVGADEELRATRIELLEAAAMVGTSELEVKGVVLSATDAGFELDLDGDFSTSELSVALDTAPCDTPTAIEPAELDLEARPFVEVDGILIGDAAMCASEVQLEAESVVPVEGDGEEPVEVEIEGIVSDFVSLASFRVAGTRVDASSAGFDPETLALELADGSRVEVGGTLARGVLTAEQVELRDVRVRIEAVVANLADVDLASGSFSLLGISVRVEDATRFDDLSDLSDLRAGDFLEVRGVRLSAGAVLATRIRRGGGSADAELRGPVEAVFTSSVPRRLTILGVDFEADAQFTGFEDSNGQAISADRFYERVREGDRLRARDCDGPATRFDRACKVGFQD